MGKGAHRSIEKSSKGYFSACSAPHSHRRIGKFDPKRAHTTDKIRLGRPLPDSLSHLTVHIIEDLRSALDQAAFAVIGTNANKTLISFPIMDTKRKFNSALSKKCKDVPDEIKAVFAQLKPYKRGNAPLWGLNKLSNICKHRTIIQPGVAIKDMTFPAIPNAFYVRSFALGRWNRRKNEIILSRAPGKGTVEHDVNFGMGIVFGKVPVFGGQPVLATLRGLTTITERIIMAIEAEAIRIGTIR